MSFWRCKLPQQVLRAALLAGLAFGTPKLFAEIPGVGSIAPNFTLATPTGKSVELSSLERKQRTVLVVLRGYPGYQCPYCVKQVHDFVEHASAFAQAHAQVLLVYPGPPADLDQHARDFLAKQAALPDNIVLVTDPDYTMTNQYDLRWNAPQETAHPSTFILDTHGKIVFEKVSHSHGDRVSAQDALNALTQ